MILAIVLLDAALLIGVVIVRPNARDDVPADVRLGQLWSAALVYGPYIVEVSDTKKIFFQLDKSAKNAGPCPEESTGCFPSLIYVRQSIARRRCVSRSGDGTRLNGEPCDGNQAMYSDACLRLRELKTVIADASSHTANEIQSN